jgi:hypothetical protein
MEAATQMKNLGYEATRTARTRAAAIILPEVVKIASGNSNWKTWNECPSRRTAGHFPVYRSQTREDVTRRHCKMSNCHRQIQIYCRQCDVPLCIDDVRGTNCFQKFHNFEHLDIEE